MSETDELTQLRSTVESLAAKVRALEDQVEITQLVAQYGPAVDSGSGRLLPPSGPRTVFSTRSPTCGWRAGTASSAWSTAPDIRA